MPSSEKTRVSLFLLAFFFIIAISVFISQGTNSKEQAEKPKPKGAVTVSSSAHGEFGEAVQKSCLTCHATKEDGSIERISDVRKTPEGWEETITRMEQAWGLKITPEDKAAVIAELSNKNGLAPEETEKVMYWLANNGSTMEPEVISKDGSALIQNSCIACHAGGRPLAQYRTTEEWQNLKDFHLAFNPSVVYQMRSQNWEEEAQKVVDYLAKTNDIDSKEWKEWKEKNTVYDISGEWRIVEYRPGIGLYSGYATFKENDGNYRERRQMLSEDGKKENYEGTVRMFTGYSLRSSLEGKQQKVRGVYNVQEGGDMIEGRWNQVNDIGQFADGTYYKADKETLITTWPASVQKGRTTTVHLIGSNLPSNLTKDDFEVSDGLVINEVKKQEKDDVWVNVEIQEHSSLNTHTIALKGKGEPIKLNVYEKVDYLKVNPEYGLARIKYSGKQQSVQFEAVAYTVGADGKKDTKDDVEIGPVKANWGLKEYLQGETDDHDLSFIGKIDAKTGLFTPAKGGLNPQREWSTNNAGNVTVTATYADSASNNKVTGDAFLMVSVPDLLPIH